MIPVAALRPREPESPGQRGRDLVDLAGSNLGLDRNPHPRQRDVGRVVVDDARQLARNLGQGQVGDAVAIGHAAAHEDPGVLELPRELLQETRLAHTRVPEHGHELRCTLAPDTSCGEPKQRELVLAADQRRGMCPSPQWTALPWPKCFPGADRQLLPLGVELPQIAVGDRSLGREPRPLPHENRARLGELLNPRGDVHRVTGHDELSARGSLSPGDHLARVHTDSQADVRTVALRDPRGESREPVADRERRSNRALGVVLVCLWRSEDRDDRVADELLSDTTVPFHLATHEVEELALDFADILRVDALPQGGRAGEIGEEHRDDPAFLVLGRNGRPLRIRAKGGAARGAERRRGRLLAPARGARRPQGGAAGLAEARVLGGLRAARDAGAGHGNESTSSGSTI